MPDETPEQDDSRDKIDAARERLRQLGLDQHSGWCAPTESERWQCLTPEERRVEWCEAEEAARRTGSEVMSVGGMLLPYPLFTHVEPPSGMWPPDGMTTRIGSDDGDIPA